MVGEVKNEAGGEARPMVMMRAAGLISILTMLSRVLGLVREQVFARLLGAGLYADAFQVAFRIPNLLRDLFAEGALSAAFVPTYTRALKEGGDARAHQVASRVLAVLLAVLGVIVLLAFVFAAPLVGLLAGGFYGLSQEGVDKTQLTIFLTRVMLPFLPLVSLAAVAMGMLNARHRFGTPALAPALFNVVSILWGVGLWALGYSGAQVALGWAIGTVLGGAAQLLVQVPPLWREGWRPQLEWNLKDPALRDIARLMGPATVGLAAVQVNIFVGTSFASSQDGAVSWLMYAFRILYLPIGIFGVAMGTVATVGLSSRAADGDLPGVRAMLERALRSLGFLTVPATVGLVVLAVPIVRLLFQGGAFTATDTHHTAVATAVYAIGLVSYTSVKVLAPAFYALGSPRVPLAASASAVATNLVIIVLMHGRFGYLAIALGTALGSVVNALILVGVLHRRLRRDGAGPLVGLPMVGAFARMALAASAMAPVCLLSLWFLESRMGTEGLLARLLTGLVPIGLGGAVYFGMAALLRLHEMGSVVAAVRRRRAR